MDIRKAAVLLLCLAMGAVSYAGTQAPGTQAPFPLPEIKKDCTICHVTEGAGNGALLKKKPPELCLDCHPDRVPPGEHKVDIVPSAPVKKLPLTDGKITCITCHDPHKNLYGKLLRMPETELCTVCHPY
jgi:predicted CXXCH cytochrome family protein